MLTTLACLAPALLLGALVLRGFRPWPLVAAMLWRFRWVNLLFVLLIALAGGTGVGLLALERGLRRGTAAAADKFDLVVAAPGSEITMLMAAVYLQPSDVGLLSGETFHAVATHPNVALAAPLAFGDSHDGHPVVGTTAAFLRHLTDDRIEGRMFATPDEAVMGAAVPLGIGDRFQPQHGHGDMAEAHDGPPLAIVGRMAATGTPWDSAILVPVETVWQVHGLANGHAPERGDLLGPPFDPAYFPGTPAIVVQADTLWGNYALRSAFTRDAVSMAFFPGEVLSTLYRVMGDVRQAMSALALVALGLVACAVLVGLLILIRLFQRHLALLRALGAPARFVFAVVWSYAATLLAAGGALGLIVGQLSTGVLAAALSARMGLALAAPLGWPEAQFAATFVSLASLLALLPARNVLRQPVTAGLRG